MLKRIVVWQWILITCISYGLSLISFYSPNSGELGKMPTAVKDSLPSTDVIGAAASASPLLDDDEDEEDDMRARLEALRS